MGDDRKYVPTKLTPEELRRLLHIRGELPPKVFLILSKLGGHLESGWQGSVQKLTRILADESGSRVGQSDVGVAVAKLEAAGLLTVEGFKNGPRRFLLGSRESRDLDHGKAVSRSRESRDLDHGKAVIHSMISEKEEREGEREAESARAPANNARPRDVERPSRPSRPHRRDELVRATADGLTAELAAVGLSLSQRQVELLVGEVGADEVRRQLAAWPRRDTSWAKRPAALFSKYCREGEPPPINGDGASKPRLSPDAVAVLRDELRDRRVTRGDVARALRAVGAPDLEHLTADGRRALLAVLEAS